MVINPKTAVRRTKSIEICIYGTLISATCMGNIDLVVAM